MTHPKDEDEFLRELRGLEQELDERFDDAIAPLAGALPAVGADAGIRARLLASSKATHRFDDLVERIAQDADLPASRVDALLLGIDDPATWEAGPAPGIELYHFEGGPKTATAVTGFVRVATGGSFPHHGHLGSEVVVVLQGEARDTSTGEVHGRGARITAEPGVEHALEVTSDIPFVYLAVVEQGIRVGDRDYKYDDPDM